MTSINFEKKKKPINCKNFPTAMGKLLNDKKVSDTRRVKLKLSNCTITHLWSLY